MQLQLRTFFLLVAVALGGCGGGSASSAGASAFLQSVSIAPNQVTTGVNILRRLTATGTYSDGTTVDLTSTASWSSSSSSIATVTGGLVTGIALGATNVTATSGGISATSAVTVTSNVWSVAANLLLPMAPGFTATALNDGRVLVVGGENNLTDDIIADAEIYDPVENTWTAVASMNIARQYHTATLLASGKVLVSGGSNPGAAGLFNLSSAEIYDPGANTWSLVGSMSTGRAGHTATLLTSGKVLVVAGSNGGTVDLLMTSEIFDPSTNSWTPAASLAQERSGHTATLLQNGDVLVAAGFGGRFTYLLATAELYDPIGNTWSSAGSISAPKSSQTATLLPNGQVLVAGGLGGTAEQSTVYSSADIYDPDANAWSSAASMLSPLYGHTATLLPNGTVLIVGGADLTSVGTVNTEIYDPIAQGWTSGANLVLGRFDHAATLLGNGELLILAGQSIGQSQTLATECEVHW